MTNRRAVFLLLAMMLFLSVLAGPERSFSEPATSNLTGTWVLVPIRKTSFQEEPRMTVGQTRAFLTIHQNGTALAGSYSGLSGAAFPLEDGTCRPRRVTFKFTRYAGSPLREVYLCVFEPTRRKNVWSGCITKMYATLGASPESHRYQMIKE